MPRKKPEVNIETDGDFEVTLYSKSCVLCKSGNRPLGKTCADCINSKNHCNFKRLAVKGKKV